MDIIHYNSSVTKSVYEAVFDLPKNCIVTITHADITDNRRIKKFSDDQLHIRYLGPQSGAKGYIFIKRSVRPIVGEKNRISALMYIFSQLKWHRIWKYIRDMLMKN